MSQPTTEGGTDAALPTSEAAAREASFPSRPTTGGPVADADAGPPEAGVDAAGVDAATSPLVAILRRIPLTTWVTGFLVGGSVLFVLWVVNPDGLLFTRSTPTGGDLGAHVWGPAFIRDELLPRFRLTGWTPDWYAGFPAYYFYMVVPMLLVVAVILLTGVFIETASALIILTPVLLPLVLQLGIDPIHFGLIIVVGLSIGMITPPVAINLYVASSVTQLPLERITRAIIPYLLGLIGVLLLVVYVPILLGWSGS